MKKILFAILVLCVASCVKRDDVTLNRFVALHPKDLSSADLVVNITNNSRHSLNITALKLTFEDGGKRFAEVTIASPVEVSRRFTGDVAIPLRMRITDPFAALGSVQRLAKGSQTITVRGEGVAKIGAFSKKLDVPPTPITQFLKQAGIDPAQFLKSLGI